MKLLSPTPLGALTLPNRVVMAPMTRNRATGTVPTSLMVEYYRQRVSAGLIITEAAQVTPRGQGYPDTPGIHTDEQVARWRGIMDAVHAEGGRIFLQLWHVGRVSHSSFHGGRLPVAPSALPAEGKAFTAEGRLTTFEVPHALTEAEISEIVEAYREGAENARAAGFDGVEVHGANGYLLDQFLQSGSNQRTDRYGGSAENRARLLLEVIEGVTEVWGQDRVGVRLGPAGGVNGVTDADPFETFEYVARRLDDLDLAYLHLVDGRMPDGRTASAFMRAAYDGTLIAAGGYDRASAEAALQEGRLDLVAFGRPFISNPDLPERFAQDAPLTEWDPATFYGGNAEGYVTYPLLAEEELA